MSEKSGYTEELLNIYEIVAQKDEFISSAKAIDRLFKGGTRDNIRVEGSMSMVWQVPEGLHLEVSHRGDGKYYAMTMHESEHDYRGKFNEDAFDLQTPLIVHEIAAFPHYGDTPCGFELRSRQEGLSYQLFSVWGSRIDEFNILPMPDVETPA